MSFQKFKDAVNSRTLKVKEMEKNFEPSPRIAAFKTASRQVIIEDYRKALKESIAGIQIEQERIRDKHIKMRPPLTEQAQRASLESVKFRAMTTAQLKAAMQDTQKLPPQLIDPVEVRCLGAELRGRGDNDNADMLSQWAYASFIDEPWIADPTWKELQNRVERFRVFDVQAQDGMIITSTDQTIDKSDIIRLDGGA